MRSGGVPPATMNDDFELIHRRHDRTGCHPDGPDGQVIPQMDAEGCVDSGRVQHSVRDHRLRPIRGLFRRLERKLHAAVQRDGREPARDLETDRDVPVMSARVHLAGMARAVGNVVGFLDG